MAGVIMMTGASVRGADTGRQKVYGSSFPETEWEWESEICVTTVHCQWMPRSAELVGWRTSQW